MDFRCLFFNWQFFCALKICLRHYYVSRQRAERYYQYVAFEINCLIKHIVDIFQVSQPTREG